jgi:hypothetical protein
MTSLKVKKTKKTQKNKNKTMINKTKNRIKTRKHGKGSQTRKTYDLNDYKSSDGMLTTVWGPSLWHFLHTMSFNYPVEPTMEQKNQYRSFILSLQYILPCKYCRINLKKNFKSLPLTMDKMKNRESFSRYVYDLHELINGILNKKSNLSYDDVRERYEHFRARCTEEKSGIFNEKMLNKISKTIKQNSKTAKKQIEKGCTEPLYGKKSRCIIKIVPQDKKGESFQMDEKCIKKRLSVFES